MYNDNYYLYVIVADGKIVLTSIFLEIAYFVFENQPEHTKHVELLRVYDGPMQEFDPVLYSKNALLQEKYLEER